MPPLFDAHNHLQDPWLAPHRDRLPADLAVTGVRACVVNGTSESDWPDVAALCSRLSTAGTQLLPSFGLHPWDAGNRTPGWQEKLVFHLDRASASSPEPAPKTPDEPGPPTAALAKVGEIGLDRWILDRARPDDPRLAGLRRAPLDEQIEVFRWQLALAAERNLPASIHCLDAFGPLLDVLRTTPLPPRGFLLHAYSGPPEMVPAFARLGAHFSFNGSFLPAIPLPAICHIMSDKSPPPLETPPSNCHTLYDIPKKRLRRLAFYRDLPADRLLIETDAPAMPLPKSLDAAFLSAEAFASAERPDAIAPRRYDLPPSPDGHPINHPANIALTYAALAELRGVTRDSLAAQVAANFSRLFGFTPEPTTKRSETRDAKT